MLNPIECYREAGQKAAIARHERDEARAQHWGQWVRRALALENEESRKKGRAEYEHAYKREQERHIRSPGGAYPY